ncbi:Linoleoyl-CoA desaturase [Trichophyton interdigitale]|uniref:Delta 8-(E)-sphingolipid desaturase n=1 Tax=Trichophyton interdigitale TaxID=101480 RepID=A0A9P4YNG4_9EURO|nr:Linoleoyl-CoA desaturase [Trichophyton interdigitale]KAF3900755.1 Linoleoyl-CoA desaturase [Trichophyton interdigitale]KAG8211683.1 Linoleoyl-CoA desaturase [Trichophyton interdigitale]
MAASRKSTVLTRHEIGKQIADGRHIVIFEGRVLKLDAWLPFHPGGDKAIQHMVGRDATDEMNALHSAAAKERMKSFQIGRIEGAWVNFLPPIQGGDFSIYNTQDLSAAIESDDNSSGNGQSIPPSPLFEPADKKESGLRRRGSVSTSISSVGTASPEKKDSKTRPFFLDARTQEEIAFDTAKYPPVTAEEQERIVQKYRQLYKRLLDEGLFNCNYSAYLVETSRYLLLFGLFLYFLHCGWYGTSGFFLGCTWHQLVFTVHDAGHLGITHDFHTDTVIGILIADFIGGLSIGWWKRNHNVHHIVTNSPEHDPDIEHMPFFAVSHRLFGSLRSTYYERVMEYDFAAKFLIRFQHFLYYPLLCFGRFNLYRLSWEHLIRGQGPRKGAAWWHRWLEIAGHVFFWAWFGYGVLYRCIPDWQNRVLFIMVSHMITAPLHVQITLSHFAMSTSDMGVHESFPQKMLRTTMDVDCPQWLDFFHGGLQFQAVHHLFPRLPRHNLRRAQKLVIEFCEETKIPYAIFSFVDGNKEVIGHLGNIAKQARMLAECQKSIAEKGVFSDHHH